MEAGNELKLLKASDGQLLRSLEAAIQLGTPVLLQDVGEALDPALEPLLQKHIFMRVGAPSAPPLQGDAPTHLLHGSGPLDSCCTCSCPGLLPCRDMIVVSCTVECCCIGGGCDCAVALPVATITALLLSTHRGDWLWKGRVPWP
jgi:hypothetical protein